MLHRMHLRLCMIEIFDQASPRILLNGLTSCSILFSKRRSSFAAAGRRALAMMYSLHMMSIFRQDRPTQPDKNSAVFLIPSTRFLAQPDLAHE